MTISSAGTSKCSRFFQQIRDVSGYGYPVHISGETGTGKELVAVAIHRESHPADAPFVPINCGALPEGLIESELFGHVRGAFSGAIREKKGRFQLADGGTIFSGRSGRPFETDAGQAAAVSPGGGHLKRSAAKRPSRARVKIISATNKNLKQEVRKNRFREDLFYRLNVIPIQLPPLRERKNDIPLLIEHFIKEDGDRYGHRPIRISKDTVRVMMDYHWPGNVRELQNVVQFAIVKCSGRVIRPEDLPLELGRVECRVTRPGPPGKLDAVSVRSVLDKTGGNKSRAARMLGVGRATLYRFFKEHPEVNAES